jgi:Xaa-Pro aminopeptidase
MRACRPGMAEYELEAELSYEFRRRGADGHAYTPIVAGGANACILHYVENNRLLAGHSLVLIDAGCELAGYASDITRTFPVSGRFSPEQREVYEIVLAAQQAAIAAVRPGASFMAYHQAALRVLSQGLIDLKLISGSVDGAIESEAYKPWYMHRTGHWLGLDVHDAGDYRTGSADDDWVRLLPGMTLTVEPGLYFRPARRCRASARHRRAHRGRCAGHRRWLHGVHQRAQDRCRNRRSDAPWLSPSTGSTSPSSAPAR